MPLSRLIAKSIGQQQTTGASAEILTALTTVLVAAIVYLAARPVLGGAFPFACFYPAVALAALRAGSRAGLISVALAVAVVVTVHAPTPAPIDPPAALFGVSLFVASAAFVALLGGAHRRTLIEKAAQLEQARIAERRLLLAQEVGGLGVFDWDLQTGDVHWSAAFRDSWGYDEGAEASYDRFLSGVHPEDRDRVRQAVERALATGAPYEAEYRALRADGTVVWMEGRGEIQTDEAGRPVRMVGVSRDVTARRRADSALRESEQRFRLIADSAPAPMWVSRPDGRREMVNRAYAAFVAMTPEEAAAMDWRHRIHPDDQKRIYREQVEGEASGQPFSLEARYLRHDGAWRTLRSYSQPRTGPQGEPLGFVGVAIDVTEEKRVEEDLKRINDLLAERVDMALSEKAKAEAALMRLQKLEAVGRLTGGVAHDFNNLLTVVIGALDMILKHPGDAEKRRRMAEAAMAAARRGERLTHQLLAFSRRQALRPELCRVAELVRDSEPLLRRAVGEAVRFELSLDERAVAHMDPAQFEAALLNLVVNARDATPAGGLIRVEVFLTTVDEAEGPDLAPGDYVGVRVQDTGEGMPVEVREQAFEPFFTTKPIGKGTGLGLSQVYGFARQTGGDAQIIEPPEGGAAVTIYLPLARAEPQVRPAAPARSASPQGRLQVLLVEDDADVAMVAETMLAEMGHRVVRAENAETALRTLRGRAAFDVLLTDVIMPGGVNGVELARSAVTLRPGLGVILTTGYAGAAIDQLLTDAPWPLLHKPFSGGSLTVALASALHETA